MSQVVAILILVPTAAALVLIAAYIVGMLISFFAAGVDGLVVGIRHRMHPAAAQRRDTFHRPALHH